MNSKSLLSSIANVACLISIFCSTHVAAQVRPRVIGGEEAAPNEFPWMVLIHEKILDDGVRPSHICGGTLISPEWVLTATHCVNTPAGIPERKNPPLPFGSPRDYFVSFGSNSSLSGRQVRQVVEIALPPRGNNITHDVALLRLSKPIRGVTPLPWTTLAEKATASGVGTATLIGWGATNPDVESIGAGVYPEMLQKAALTVFSDAQCKASLGNVFYADDNLCAAVLASDSQGTGAKDACYGDSGGPLVATIDGTLKQIGVVSRGFQCASDKYPGIFSEVASYDSFITATLNSSRRVRYLVSTILGHLEIALARSPTDDDFANTVNPAESAALLQRSYRQFHARQVIYSFMDSLIISVSRDRSRLNRGPKSVSLRSLKARQRRLISGITMAASNKLGANRSKKLLDENRAFFQSLLK